MLNSNNKKLEYDELVTKRKGIKMKYESLLDYCDRVKNPRLLKEFDLIRNLPTTPKTIGHSSCKKIYWKCEKGHSYLASPNAKTKNKWKATGCPYCYGRIPFAGDNDLATKRPNLLKYWNYEKNTIKPTEISPRSEKKVYWKLPCGHELYRCPAFIHNKFDEVPCPICKGANSSNSEQYMSKLLKQYFPDTITGYKIPGTRFLADAYIPSKKTVVEYDGVLWHKKVDIDERKNTACISSGLRIFRLREKGCPPLEEKLGYCPIEVESQNYGNIVDAVNIVAKDLGANMKMQLDTSLKVYEKNIIPFYKDRPDLLNMWDYDKNVLNPDSLTRYSFKKVWWKQDYYDERQDKTFHFSWCQSVRNRVDSKLENPYVHGSAVFPGYNDLETWCRLNNKMELLKEYDNEKNPLKPNEIVATSTKKVWWKTKEGFSWQKKVYERTIYKSNHPVYRGLQVIKGVNDLATLRPDIAACWSSKNEVKADEVPLNSGKIYSFVCPECKKQYPLRLQDMVRRKSVLCPTCSGNPGAPKRVRCINTNEVYPTIKAAAEHFHFQPNKIIDCCKQRRPEYKGYSFEYINHSI